MLDFFFLLLLLFWCKSSLWSSQSSRVSKHKKEKKSHRLFHMLDLYIFTFRYVQCSHVTRLHHLKKKNSKKPGHLNCCASSLVNTCNPHYPRFLFHFLFRKKKKRLQLIQFSRLWYPPSPDPQVAHKLWHRVRLSHIYIYIYIFVFLRPPFWPVSCCIDRRSGWSPGSAGRCIQMLDAVWI